MDYFGWKMTWSFKVLNVFLIALLPLTRSKLSPPDRTYNVLILSPATSSSHIAAFVPLMDELGKRGHQVTCMGNDFNHPTPPNANVTFLRHRVPHTRSWDGDMFKVGSSYWHMLNYGLPNFWQFSQDFYRDPVVRELYKRKDEFDLVIVDFFLNEAALPFAHGKPLIGWMYMGVDSTFSSFFGMPNPSYVSNSIEYLPPPWSIMTRALNLLYCILTPALRFLVFLAPAQYEMWKRFPHLPWLTEIEHNMSMGMVYYAPGLSVPEPLLPGQVAIGGLHCRPGEQLPEKLLNFVSGDIPVVYISLGTVVNSKFMPTKYKEFFFSAIAKLPYKFIWKYDDENLPDLPSKIIFPKYVPQQDLLAHPNVRMFVTHNGVMSTQESICHKTPMLGLPVFGDQLRTSAKMAQLGYGFSFTWEELSEELLIESITELITNNKYQAAVTHASALFHDQPEPPLERAVFWIEYVARHGGAQHLKSPGSKLTIVQHLHLDIFALILLTVFVAFTVIRKLVQ